MMEATAGRRSKKERLRRAFERGNVRTEFAAFVMGRKNRLEKERLRFYRTMF